MKKAEPTPHLVVDVVYFLFKASVEVFYTCKLSDFHFRSIRDSTRSKGRLGLQLHQIMVRTKHSSLRTGPKPKTTHLVGRIQHSALLELSDGRHRHWHVRGFDDRLMFWLAG